MVNQPPVVDLLIRGTAVGAVLGYAVRLGMDGSRGNAFRSHRESRVAWTFGALFLLVHSLLAMHFRHRWSQAAAWEYTRQQTWEQIGWNSGAGIYANEILTLAWLMDVVCWWSNADWPRQQRLWYWFLQSFLALMLFNATVVFGPWYWTPLVCGGLLVLAMRTLAQRLK